MDQCRGSDSILNVWGPADSLRSVTLAAVRSKHLRNLVLLSAALSVVSRESARRLVWMPRVFRRGLSGLFSFFFLSLWLLFYHFRVREKPVIRYRRTMWNIAIMERLKLETFKPVAWGFNSHIQTVLCNSLNKLDEVLRPFAAFRRQVLPAFDSGNSVRFVTGLVRF